MRLVQRGFTLIEIMLVLVVVSIMAGLATVAMGPNPYKDLYREALRLQAVMQMAADEAMLQGAQWSLAIPETGYQFLLFEPEELTWLPIEAEPFGLHQVHEAVSMQINVEGEQLDPRAQEQMQRMRAMGDTKLRPVILLLSSGEITPFSIIMRHAKMDSIIKVQSDGISPIEIIERESE